jgi:hypothetical protein
LAILEVYLIRCISTICLKGGGSAVSPYIIVNSLYYYNCNFNTLASLIVSGSPISLDFESKYNLNNAPSPDQQWSLIISAYHSQFGSTPEKGVNTSLASVSLVPAITKTFTSSKSFPSTQQFTVTKTLSSSQRFSGTKIFSLTDQYSLSQSLSNTQSFSKSSEFSVLKQFSSESIQYLRMSLFSNLPLNFPSESQSKSKSSIEIIIGGIVGGILALILIGFLLFKFLKRREQKVHPESITSETSNSFQKEYSRQSNENTSEKWTTKSDPSSDDIGGEFISVEKVF